MSIFEVYAHTEVGSVRTINEDCILVGRFIKNRGAIRLFLSADDDFLHEYGLLFAVADGIGSQAGGALASQTTLKTLEQQFYTIKKDQQPVFMESLLQSVRQANSTLLQIANQNPEFAHMGCTLAGVCLTPQGFIVFNTGDSRVYRYRFPLLKHLTLDDTVTQVAVRNGYMSLAEARYSEQRHKLINFIGYEGFTCTVELEPTLRLQDILLICSDGLYDLLEKQQLESILREKTGDLPTLGHRLAQQAILNGGYDNISFILIRLDNNRTVL